MIIQPPNRFRPSFRLVLVSPYGPEYDLVTHAAFRIIEVEESAKPSATDRTRLVAANGSKLRKRCAELWVLRLRSLELCEERRDALSHRVFREARRDVLRAVPVEARPRARVQRVVDARAVDRESASGKPGDPGRFGVGGNAEQPVLAPREWR
ncbi:MAG: hypothetical protein ABSC94_32150 [Polyangiaceae bacterium]